MAGRQAFKQHYPTYHPKAPPTPYRVERGCQLVIVITPLRKIHVQVGLAPTPPGLDLRRAPRIVRELPPSLTAYRVAVWFRAAPLAAPTLVRSTVEDGQQKSHLLLRLVVVPRLGGQTHE